LRPRAKSMFMMPVQISRKKLVPAEHKVDRHRVKAAIQTPLSFPPMRE